MEPGVIVLVGPDGCGKSTVAEILTTRLRDRSWEVTLQHWRPNLLPSPRRLLGQQPTSDPSKPHAAPLHPRVISAGLALYYWLDFWLGHVLRTRPCIRRGGVVIAERYVYDLVADPYRHRLRAASRYLLTLAATAPWPGSVFLLTADPNVIHKRKSELDPAVIRRQLRALTRFFAGRPNVHVLDTTDMRAEEAAAAILQRLDKETVPKG